MKPSQSRLTGQGQISVPSDVRRRLGIGPGSVLEWTAEGDRIVVRRVGRHSSEDVHHALFVRTPRARPLSELKEGIRRHVKARRARD